jgi:thiamine biosynthesis lipoprotein
MNRTLIKKAMIPLDSEGSFALKRLKRITAVLFAAIIMIILLCGCTTGKAETVNSKFRGEFMDTFDTIVIVVAYAESEEEFNKIYEMTHSSFLEMHRLFDIYHDYEGINNLKTINENAGIQPVKADERIIDMIKLAKEWYVKTDGIVNIAMGPVLKIWHDYREAGIADPEQAKLPPIEDLNAANRNTDIDNVMIDESASTVFLKDKGMSLDVGAAAKGYTAEIVADELKSAGYDSVLLSAGGNIRAVGGPKDGIRSKWGVGIKDPDSLLAWSEDEENLLDVAFVTDMSVVSSGGYERYYTVNGTDYHHLIDPETLMPANYYKAVTVVTEDSAVADILSTVLFILPPEDSLAFAESLNVEALWVMPDNNVMTTAGLKQMLRDMGGASSK